MNLDIRPFRIQVLDANKNKVEAKTGILDGFHNARVGRSQMNSKKIFSPQMVADIKTMFQDREIEPVSTIFPLNKAARNHGEAVGWKGMFDLGGNRTRTDKLTPAVKENAVIKKEMCFSLLILELLKPPEQIVVIRSLKKTPGMMALFGLQFVE